MLKINLLKKNKNLVAGGRLTTGAGILAPSGPTLKRPSCLLFRKLCAMSQVLTVLRQTKKILGFQLSLAQN